MKDLLRPYCNKNNISEKLGIDLGKEMTII